MPDTTVYRQHECFAKELFNSPVRKMSSGKKTQEAMPELQSKGQENNELN